MVSDTVDKKECVIVFWIQRKASAKQNSVRERRIKLGTKLSRLLEGGEEVEKEIEAFQLGNYVI